MLLIAIALIVMGIILYIVDKKSESKIEYKDITFKQSLLIALSQAIAAAFPGVSRSGITMTVARALKIDRESAAKYSFLLSTPIIAAAVLFSITDFQFTLAFFLRNTCKLCGRNVCYKVPIRIFKKRKFQSICNI